jgi:Ca2+-binding RTX toxin-like protein
LFREELHGDAGNDILIAGVNRDLLDGGTEAAGVVPPAVMLGHLAVQGDTVSYQASNAGVTVNLSTGQATGGFAQGDTLQGIENLVGSNFRDVLTGDAGANVLDGGHENDVLTGKGGNDIFLFRFNNQSTGYDTVTDFSAGDRVVLDTSHNIHLTQAGNDTMVTVDGYSAASRCRGSAPHCSSPSTHQQASSCTCRSSSCTCKVRSTDPQPQAGGDQAGTAGRPAHEARSNGRSAEPSE